MGTLKVITKEGNFLSERDLIEIKGSMIVISHITTSGFLYWDDGDSGLVFVPCEVGYFLG